MLKNKKYVAIVDAYSAGNLLASEFGSRNHPVIHVQSTKEIWPILLPTFRPEDFESNIIHDGDLGKTVEALRAFSLACILPGTETGVELADELSKQLELPGNGTRKSEARRNKFLMAEAVREHGLLAAQQIQTDRAEEILSWANRNDLSRIVIKPLKSAGTDSVAVCSTPAEIKIAAEAILGKTNKLGIPNDAVLAQEFLSGTEYFINTVSQNGRHHVTEIWRYQKRSINGHHFVYDCNELCEHDGEIETQLRNYVVDVLAALEIEHGPAHTEVMMTGRGPVLVESGARLDGLSVPSVNQASIGYGPLDLTADAYVDKAQFDRKTAIPYKLLKHARTVYLTSYADAVVKAIPGESVIRNLPSFFQMRLRVKDGASVKKTIDYFTAPGFVTLVHPDAGVIQRDYEVIRKLELDGLFVF